jgi:hypothetical protein
VRYRQYIVDVARTQRQAVTFVMEMGNATADTLAKVAAAHCVDGRWSEPEWGTGNISSEAVLVLDPAGVPVPLLEDGRVDWPAFAQQILNRKEPQHE